MLDRPLTNRPPRYLGDGMGRPQGCSVTAEVLLWLDYPLLQRSQHGTGRMLGNSLTVTKQLLGETGPKH